MNTEDILRRLLAFRAVTGGPNTEITGWVAAFLEDAGAEVSVLPGPDPRRRNILASFGPRDRAGLVLSAHLDVVPAEEPDWRTDPFELTESDGQLHGRGTSDMQGFVACLLSLAPEFAKSAEARTVHLALSYDEEIGCRGVPHLLAELPTLCARPFGALIGEPTGLVPVRGHKGKAAVEVTVRGTPGHSSRPDLGRNAIHGLSRVLSRIVGEAGALEAGPVDHTFAPPFSTMQAGTISGGQALNIIPAEARLAMEVRAIPGVEPMDLVRPVLNELAALEADGFGTAHDVVATYPALTLPTDHPMTRAAEAASGKASLGAVSFGTEAGLYQKAGIPSVICGPGDIARAHKANEYVLRAELDAARTFLADMVLRAAAP
ncbi:acetylornithine deacetylase [Roseicyclus sp. F158]|uniref:Acetylornithine deacetylase n=1 Tax=Tropicimonas omnivorans TaxID=3075590 RepID=A0ABU3DKG4_9RHOB|nr:acetylornithine deacetylase [Roseicyclus sp. F158]MDT0684206.1 acetylornithine deacetylase [Roseicyclus sp. F158]